MWGKLIQGYNLANWVDDDDEINKTTDCKVLFALFKINVHFCA